MSDATRGELKVRSSHLRRPRGVVSRLVATAVVMTMATVLAACMGGGSVVGTPTVTTHPASTPQTTCASPRTPGLTSMIGSQGNGSQVHIPVLMYHYIRINPVATDTLGFNLSVTPRDFEAQLAWLRANGYQSISMAQATDAIENGAQLPAKPIVITFDDGYDDFYTTALPLLRKYGFRGEAYIVPDFLNHPHYMTTDQVKTAAAEGTFIGAHTMDHIALARVQPYWARYQIDASRKALQKLTCQGVTDFAYPYGSFNPAVERLVAQAGFTDAVTTRPGGYHPAHGDPYAISRVRVSGGESLASFAASITG